MFTDACTTYSDYFLYSAMKKVDSIFFKAQETERLVTHRCATVTLGVALKSTHLGPEWLF